MGWCFSWVEALCERSSVVCAYYLASRLITKLSGSARRLAMTWKLADFNEPNGVRILLQKLGAVSFGSQEFAKRCLDRGPVLCLQETSR